MPISSTVLSAIQSAGDAVYAADQELKKAVKEYASQVSAAMQDNPFNIGSDELFEEWKSVARLSQAMAQVEAELRNIHAATSALSARAIENSSATIALSGRATLESVTSIDATAVRPKRRVKKPNLSKTAVTNTKAPRKGPHGFPVNASKVMAQVTSLQNSEAIAKVNWSEVASKCGLPKGSVGSSVAKLKSLGLLIEGEKGNFKLGSPANA